MQLEKTILQISRLTFGIDTGAGVTVVPDPYYLYSSNRHTRDCTDLVIRK